MTREEFDRLRAMVESDNLDDVMLGMQLVYNQIESIPVELLRYFYIISNCTMMDLVDLDCNSAISELIINVNTPANPYDYVK